MRVEAMSHFNPTLNNQYRHYAELLLDHHRFLIERNDDSVEAVAAELTAPWDELDATQRRSLAGLGSDLNWVRRDLEPPRLVAVQLK